MVLSNQIIFSFFRIFFLSRKEEDGTYKRLVYHDGWLLTHPDEDFNCMVLNDEEYTNAAGLSTATAEPTTALSPHQVRGQRSKVAMFDFF